MDATKFNIDSFGHDEGENLIEVTLVASTPQEAYQLAKKKYDGDFKLISARQIFDTIEKSISCEITVSVGKNQFLELITNR